MTAAPNSAPRRSRRWLAAAAVAIFASASVAGSFSDQTTTSTDGRALAAAPLPAPSGVTASAGDGQVMVWWNPPANDDGLSGYRVERRIAGAGWTTAEADTGSVRPWYFDTGVDSATGVQYRVAALADSEVGATSSESATVTPGVRRFPVARSANDRFLVDQDGDPWYGVGDTAWSASAQLGPSDARFYLDSIAGMGMNVVLISAPEPYYTTQTPSENNIEGESPFAGTPFASSLNERYWELVDFFIAYASVSDIFVIVTPAYLGFWPGDGWQSEVGSASTAQLQAYGQALEQRYGSLDNVGWLVGHDLQDMPAGLRNKLKTIADELSGPLFPGSHHQSGATSLQAEEWVPPFNVSSFLSDSVYSYSVDPVSENHDGWRQTPTTPTAFFEGFYEQEQGNRVERRYQTWGSFVGGAAWVLFGNNPRWNFEGRPIYGYSGTWESSLSSPGTLDHARFGSFVDALPFDWSATAPDLSGTVLTGGERSGPDRAGIRTSPDGGVLYMPSSRSVTIDLTEFAAGGPEVAVERFDPSNGATSAIGTFPTTQNALTIDSPGSNASGAGDWAFVFRTLGDVAESGLLRVTTEPAVPARIFVDGVPRNDWGLEWVSLDAGSHEVCFSDVPGFATPACQTVDVVPGETTVAAGEFTRLGLLKVEVDPAGLPTTVFVDGEPRDEYGLYAFIEPGQHNVCWGDVPSHEAPPCQTVEVVAGAQETVTGSFVASESPPPGPAPSLGDFGFLRVTTAPPIVSRVLVDGFARSDWGLNGVKIPVGEHEVCFTDVVGFTAPPCRSVTIASGQTTETVGQAEQLGLLKIEVAPAGLPVDVFVDGLPRNQFGAYLFIEPGTYEVCGDDLVGWDTPTCVQATVDVGAQTTAQLPYQPS